MYRHVVASLVGVVMALCVLAADGGRILAVFPTQSPSHYILVKPLLESLVRRGHQITALTPYPQREPMPGFRDIVVLKDYRVFLDQAADNQQMHDMRQADLFEMMMRMSTSMAHHLLQQHEIKELMARRNETFDLVLVDVCVDEVLFGFAAHFNASIVGVAPFGPHIWNTLLTGAPTLPSHMAYPFNDYDDAMTFWERVRNFYSYAAEYYFYHYRYLPAHERLFATYFGHTGTTLAAVQHNFSLVLLNQHSSLGVVRPYLPNMIEVGGMQVSPSPKPLPPHLQEFLDNATTTGAIYFSLGSNIKSANMSPEKRAAIIGALRRLPQRILWKFERGNMTDVPDNVLISDWLPQSDVLAHRNVRVFITHGGLLSTTEAIVRGKPVLGIPFFADQYMNIRRAVRTGYGLLLDYNDITEDTLRSSVLELLTNDSYTNVVQTMSKRYRDKPATALETATFWIEYVLRHHGAMHLRSPAMNLNFIQYYGLDILTLALVVFLTSAWLFITLMVRITRRLRTASDLKKKVH